MYSSPVLPAQDGSEATFGSPDPDLLITVSHSFNHSFIVHLFIYLFLRLLVRSFVCSFMQVCVKGQTLVVTPLKVAQTVHTQSELPNPLCGRTCTHSSTSYTCTPHSVLGG